MPPSSYQQSCIRMTLENSELWKSFHSIGTEMIITKHGRRMFPNCSVTLSKLQPFANYVIMVDIIPADNLKYKWKKDQWEVAGKAEPLPPCRTYIHPESPAVGSHWMKQSLSFLKMKLTNNTLDQHGHIILHSMHRYYPRFHVIQADSPYTVHWASVQTFTFPETVFTAVTAYQNPKITRLKIDHNPFAKGFREGGSNFRGKSRCPNKSLPKNPSEDKKTLSENSSGLQRTPSSQPPQPKSQQTCSRQPLSRGQLSPWALEQDPAEALEPHDYSCEEQTVPASAPYQPYRPADYHRFSFPFSDGKSADAAASVSSLHPQQQDQRYTYQDLQSSSAEWSQHPLFSYSCW